MGAIQMVMGRTGVARRADVPDHRARVDVSQVAEAHHVSVTDVPSWPTTVT